MAINNITQTISELPAAGRRGIDVQTLFVTKQEDFQDHLQGTTVTELNTLKDQLNTRIGEINSTVTTMNGYADTASAGASTATTKAGEASTSASGALTSRNQAETFAQQAQASAGSVDVNNLVHRTGAETIAGVKTFSSNIVGNITGNAQTATSLLGDESNWVSYRSRSVANMLGWKNYGNGHCIFDASAGTAPNGAAVNNTYADAPWSTTRPTLMGWNGSATFGVRVDSARVADSTTYASAFTTAVGSAPSYACRAWVIFNGTGTVAISASGNVSSITDNGVGQYYVNFTTAMSDDRYATLCTAFNTSGTLSHDRNTACPISPSQAFIFLAGNGLYVDMEYISFSAVR